MKKFLAVMFCILCLCAVVFAIDSTLIQPDPCLNPEFAAPKATSNAGANILQILLGAFVGLVYSLVIYLRKYQGTQAFDIKKTLSTVFVGIFIGIISAIKGVKLTEQSFELTMVAYGGSIIAVQNGIQIILRFYYWLKNRKLKKA